MAHRTIKNTGTGNITGRKEEPELLARRLTTEFTVNPLADFKLVSMTKTNKQDKSLSASTWRYLLEAPGEEKTIMYLMMDIQGEHFLSDPQIQKVPTTKLLPISVLHSLRPVHILSDNLELNTGPSVGSFGILNF